MDPFPEKFVKIIIFFKFKPLEMVHTPNKETVIREILLTLSKKSESVVFELRLMPLLPSLSSVR